MITDRMREHGRTGKRAVSKAWILLGGSDRGGVSIEPGPRLLA